VLIADAGQLSRTRPRSAGAIGIGEDRLAEELARAERTGVVPRQPSDPRKQVGVRSKPVGGFDSPLVADQIPADNTIRHPFFLKV
jgi:hypothetical protein